AYRLPQQPEAFRNGVFSHDLPDHTKTRQLMLEPSASGIAFCSSPKAAIPYASGTSTAPHRDPLVNNCETYSMWFRPFLLLNCQVQHRGMRKRSRRARGRDGVLTFRKVL